MRVVISLFLIFLLLAACSANEETVKIGVVTILSGSDAIVGQWTMNGLEMAKDEINANGGINGRPIELIYEDSELIPQQALMGAKKLVEVNNVAALITLSGASSTLAIAPYANEKRIIQMEVICVVPECHTKDDYLFRVSGSPSDQAKYIVDVVADTDTVGILWINNDYGLEHKNSFQELYHGEILAQEMYEPGMTDLRSHITKVIAKNPERIILFSYHNDAATILKQLRELGDETQTIGVFTSQSKDLLEIAGEAAEGHQYSYFSIDDSREKAADYQYNYEKRYGESAEAFGAKSYDALLVLTEAMKGCVPNDTECIIENLYNIDNFEGASNLITIDDYGDLAHEEFEMRVVKDGAFVALQTP